MNQVPAANDRHNPSPVTLENEPNLIETFAKHVEQQGLVGETENACVAFLCAVSAKMSTPLHLTVQGSSSAGKNHLLNCACAFIPAEDKKFRTGMTPKVLMHAGETEFQHKVIIIAEYEGAKKADYSIRTFQSEKEIQWDFVDSKNGIKKKSNTVKGPAAFLQATTESVLHAENETRLMFVEIDESPEQTARINRQQALSAMGRISTNNTLPEQWHEFLRTLKPAMQISIPFADQIYPFFPSERVRSRRDFPKLLGLIEATAYLHQGRRDKGPNGEIIAAPADYEIARKLFEHCYKFGPDKRLEDLLTYAERLATFKVGDLIETSGWKKSKTYELVKRAMENGCIVDTETNGQYRFVRGSAVPPLNLPESVKADGDFPEFREETREQTAI